jgi:transcriptional regulator GlxA family with amidase domain
VHIAILTFDGYNELDSLVAFGILGRIRAKDWRVSIASPNPRVRSRSGLVIESHISLDGASAADAVIVGSGARTREIVEDSGPLGRRLRLDPSRQLVGGQCSGTLVLAKLGLLDGGPACTDSVTKPSLQAAGIEVLDQPFFAKGNVATAGGCLSSAYLAAWLIARLHSFEAAMTALDYVAPVGEKDDYVRRATRNISPYLPTAQVTS